MKILGIGVDIVENSRITKSLSNKLFVKRIFSNSEILIAKTIKIKKVIIQKDLLQKKLLLNLLELVLEIILILKIYL